MDLLCERSEFQMKKTVCTELVEMCIGFIKLTTKGIVSLFFGYSKHGVKNMKTTEKICHDVQEFPESLALEVLHFVDILKNKNKGQRNVINVKDYGAKGDGKHNDSPAIQAAINAASGFSIDSATGSGSAVSIFLPSGKYRLSKQLSIGAYTTLFGDRAILMPDKDVSAMQISGYQNNISNLVFIGGSNGISIATGNVSTCVINIEHCEFQTQTLTAIESDINSHSTLINISGCKFVHIDAAMTTLIIRTATRCHIRDSWASVAGVFAQVGSPTSGALLEVSGLLGVPGNHVRPWFINYGALHIQDSSFCGTLLKQYLVENHSSTHQIIIRRCDIYTSHIVKFHQLPETFICTDNSGMTGVRGTFWFDDGITGLEKVNDGVYVWDVHGNRNDFTHGYQGNSDAIARVMMLGKASVLKSSNLEISRKLLQVPYVEPDPVRQAKYGLDKNEVNCGLSGVPFVKDMFGATWNEEGEYSTAKSATDTEHSLQYVNYKTILTDLPDGYITVVYNVFVLGDIPIEVDTVVADNQQGHTVSAGANVLCCHGYYKAGTTKYPGIRIGFNRFTTAQYFAHTSTRIFSGIVNIDTLNTIVYGDAVPTTLLWEVGDRVIKRLPEVGQPKSWICTVRGEPGTWVSEGTL
jgi:hypothetical protein